MKSSLENMNIALVHDWITNVAGAERVMLVLKDLFPEAPIFTSVFDKEAAKPFAKYDIRTSFLQKIPLMKKKRELLIPFTPLAFEQFDLSKYDLVISSSTMAAKGIITKPNTKHICYCHTPPRYIWEPSVDPRAKAGKLQFIRKNISHNMRIWDEVAAARVDAFIANSNYIKDRIAKYYRRDAAVVYPPVDVDRFKPAGKTKIKEYFLCVGRLVDYKRYDIVIKAFNDLKLPLKIIGQGPEKKHLQKMAKKNIEFLGFISDAQIKKCYSEARAFVFAAEEDFGIVPVEAMASGRPVIAYGVGGAAETVIDGVTGAKFFEQTPQCLIEAVRKFDHTKYDSEKIRQHAEKFSTERFKKEFIDTINRLIC